MCLKNNKAFTLIEMLAVMIVIGLLAGGVTLSLSDHFVKAQLTRAVDQIETFDRQARREAQASGVRLEVTIEASRRRLRTRAKNLRSTTTLPAAIAIEDVILASGNSQRGVKTVRYFADGTGESFAIRLKAKNNVVRWMVVLGASGQIVPATSKNEVLRILGAA